MHHAFSSYNYTTDTVMLMLYNGCVQMAQGYVLITNTYSNVLYAYNIVLRSRD
jgi:hypothetical protein